jgi:hypothetical protein
MFEKCHGDIRVQASHADADPTKNENYSDVIAAL